MHILANKLHVKVFYTGFYLTTKTEKIIKNHFLVLEGYDESMVSRSKENGTELDNELWTTKFLIEELFSYLYPSPNT